MAPDPPPRRSIDRELGPLCRAQRAQANVSLQEMALRTNYNASSLSRFENGKSVPRDVDRLVAAYRRLAEDTVRWNATRKEEILQTGQQVETVPLLVLGVSVPALVVALLLDDAGAASIEGWDTRVIRVWFSFVLLVILGGMSWHAMRLRGQATTPGTLLSWSAYSLALVAQAVFQITRLDTTPDPLAVLVAVGMIGAGIGVMIGGTPPMPVEAVETKRASKRGASAGRAPG